jgi:RNA-directed DNA polymerase
VNPSLFQPADIAEAMGMDEQQLWDLAARIETFYKPQRLQKARGKIRIIDPPTEALKVKLRRLHDWLQRRRLYHPASHGGNKRRSCFSSATRHLGRRFVRTRDARDCYPSISPAVFEKELLALRFQPETARLLTLLCTVRGHIPQGAPTSNDALNLYLWRIDNLLSSFCGSRHLAYSRSADDFVVSGNDFRASRRGIGLVERELKKREIQINGKKRRETGFQPNSNVQLVHNIVVNRRQGTGISPEHKETASKLADSYVLACRSVQADSLEAVAHKRSVLVGWLHYCRQAQFGAVSYLGRQITTGDRVVLRKLLQLGLRPFKRKWWLQSTKRDEPKRLAYCWRTQLVVSAAG